MARRPLSVDDQEAWLRLAETVVPFEADAGHAVPIWEEPALRTATGKPARHPAPVPVRLPPARTMPSAPADTLDGAWDRRLRRGSVVPDRSIDLHGHNLVSAHAALEGALSDAVGQGARVLLVVTGRPPRAGEQNRGLIRASIFDWLARSPHAPMLAAVRNAHPRHGGAGALYLILRRRRAG